METYARNTQTYDLVVKYKGKYLVARRLAAGTLALFLVALAIIAWTLSGNRELQTQIQTNYSDKK